MQQVGVPQGVHNPNGYTEEEIFHELRGMHGSRRLTFRYELLDLNDVKIKDLDNVLSCSIEQNELAEIKRTASFTLEDDETINYLNDRIKPWVQLRMPPKILTVPPGERPVWFNRFNGHLGEAVTTQNSGAHGHSLKEVRGIVVYDDEHTADGQRALKLGSDDGANEGEIEFTIPERTVWSIRYWVYVPANGRFHMHVTGPGAEEFVVWPGGEDGTGDVIRIMDVYIDDDLDIFQLGETDVAAHSANLVDRMLRIEFTTDGDTANWKVFWTDVDGDTPDVDISADSSTWFPARDFVIHGGGESTDPAFVDNLRINEPTPTRIETPESQNFVEWPQGVFLLTTPSRKISDEGIITREIEAYDKLKILDDDLIPGRLADSGVLAFWDHFRRNASNGWGTSDSGHTWQFTNTANTNRFVTRAPNHAHLEMTGSTSNNTTRRYVYTPLNYGNVQVKGLLRVNKAATGSSLWSGILLRYSSTSNHYRVAVEYRTDGQTRLSVWRGTSQVGGVVNPGMTHLPGFFSFIEVRCTAHRIQAKVWNQMDPEPGNWQIDRDIEDEGLGTIDTGRVGAFFNSSSSNTTSGPAMMLKTSFTINSNPMNVYTDVIEHLIGDYPKNITPSQAIIPNTRVWEPGTSKRVIINRLLAAINYHSISADEHGVFYAHPYVNPQDRPSEFEYRDDQISVMGPETTREFDLHDVPNRWIAVGGDPEQEPITVTYENLDPASPTSIPGRGRVITRFIGGEEEEDEGGSPVSVNEGDFEAADKATMLEKVVALANESTSVFEAIEFDTAIMPFHSGNDVYRIVRDPLAINAKYAEHTWSMNLEAGAAMSHRARRVISMDATFDPKVIVGDLVVTGALSADNIAAGSIAIVPVANTPTAAAVTGLFLQGKGPIRGQCTALSSVPGSTFHEASVYASTFTGTTIYIYRTNTTTTTVFWFLMRDH